MATPALEVREMAMFDTVCPARMAFTLEVAGNGVPAAYTTEKPGWADSVMVTLPTTTPPVAGTSSVSVASRAMASRVSTSRVGVIGTNRPSPDVAALAPVK